MNRLFLASVAVLLLSVQSAFAQYGRYSGAASGYGPYSRPALSPYLNMLRGGDPAANYYLGVVPERDRRSLNVQFGAELRELEQRTSTAVTPSGDPQLPATGHTAYFLNYSSYYNFSGAGRGALAAPAQLGAPRRGR